MIGFQMPLQLPWFHKFCRRNFHAIYTLWFIYSIRYKKNPYFKNKSD